MSEALPIIWKVPVDDLAVSGRKLSRQLTDPECAALAEFAGIVAVPNLSVEGEVRLWSDGYELELRLSGDVVQSCVVTLEPVAARLEDSFVRRYLPASHAPEAQTGELDLDPDAEDPPEVLETDEIDVGAAIVEEFILALDPYPRAPGADLSRELPAQAVDDASPFAVLARLKHKT